MITAQEFQLHGASAMPYKIGVCFEAIESEEG